MSDWWARKLGRQDAPPPTPQARNLPPGYQPQPQYPQQVPQQPQQFDPNQVRVTTENLFAMAGQWQGGPAHRTETQPCPQCGGNQFFSRATGMSRLPAPAPHCYNCGYNGLFQQGEMSNWEGAAG
jgi:predicted RNA-binding Zn-ribbon protein involved in translation (DUF1610 family)